jgi:hypothetical protein
MAARIENHGVIGNLATAAAATSDPYSLDMVSVSVMGLVHRKSQSMTILRKMQAGGFERTGKLP